MAGISIAQLTGNGLFENAKLAKEKYTNSQDLENSILGEYANYIENSREEVNSQKGKWELLASTVNTTETEYTVKDLKQFSEIAVVAWYEQQIFASSEVSYDIFKISSQVNASSNTGAIRIGTSKYINDTTVKLICNGMSKVDLYGIH